MIFYSCSMVDLLLDPQIRSWVVVPIVIITFFLGIGRHYLTLLIKTKKPVEKVQLMERYLVVTATDVLYDELIPTRSILARCGLLRRNGKFIARKVGHATVLT